MQNIVNLVGKFFVLVFIGILIVGLVFWGIGDVMKGQGNTIVAQVGNLPITNYDVERQVNMQKQRLQNSGMREISPEFEKIIKKNSLTQIINTKLLEAELTNLGIELDESFVIKKDFTQDGKLDEEALQAQISASGSEETFLKDYIRDKKLEILESSFASIIPVDDEYAKLFYKFEKQKRNITIYSFDKSSVPSLKTPSDAELNDFYETQKENYRLPEYRKISYILLDKKSISIPPKNKSVEDILYEKSNNLLDKLAEGASFEEAAAELNLKISKISAIDNEGKNQAGEIINLPELDGFLPNIFALNEGETSDLLEAKDGSSYAIIKLDEISESKIQPLIQVKNFVLADYNKNMLGKAVYQKAKQLKTEVEKGTKTEEFLKNIMGVSISKMDKLDRRNQKINQQFLNLIFSVKKGGFSEIYVDENKVLFAKINEINYPEKIDEMEIFNVKSFLQDQISQEIMMQYVTYLASKYKVQSN
ncbi:MAG: SurA N-terminal domain-containing protein [Rickettsiales bacterium]|nr:SurA N-terminal domain-containing protein [Rickettsiales bacterium]